MSNGESLKKPPVKKKKSDRGAARSAIIAKQVFLVIVFLLAQVLFYYSDFFKLKYVTVHGCSRIPEDEIIRTVNIPLDRNVVTIELDPYKEKLGDLHWVKDAKLKRNLPGRVDIYIEERTPILLARQMNRPSEWYAVDDQGMVLKRAKPGEKNSFPRIVVEDKIEIGKKIPMDKVKTAKDLDPWISVDLKKKLLYYYIDERLQVIVFCKRRGRIFKIKLGKVEQMNHKMDILGAFIELIDDKQVDVKYIDLRPKDPVMMPVDKNHPDRGDDPEGEENLEDVEGEDKE